MDGLLIVVHTLHVATLGLWVGALAVLLIVLRSGRRVHPSDVVLLEHSRRRSSVIVRWTTIALLITLALEILLRALVNAHGHASSALSGPSLRALLFSSRYGQASVARWLLLVVALWATEEVAHAPGGVGVAVPRPGRHALGIVARHTSVTRESWLRLCTLVACGVLLCTAWAGPYGVTPSGTVVEAFHLAATALWLGGSIVLALAVLPFAGLVEMPRRPLALLLVLDRFTPLAVLSLLVLIVTGLLEGPHAPSARHVPLWLGAAILLKTLALITLTGLSAWSALALRPRLKRLSLRLRRDGTLVPRVMAGLETLLRLLRVMPLLAGVALACSAAADIYQVSIAAPAAPRAAPQVVGQAGPFAIALRIIPAGKHGPSSLDLALSDVSGRPVAHAVVRVSFQALALRGSATAPVVAVAAGSGHYRVPVPFSTGGPWAIRVQAQGGTRRADALFTLAAAPPHGTVTTLVPPTQQGAAVAPTAHAPAARGDKTGAVWQPLGPRTLVHALSADRFHPSRLYEATTEGIFRSDDLGAHWVRLANGLVGAARDVQAIGVLPDRSLVAATGNGVFRSTDEGAHWLPAGLAGRTIYTLAAHDAHHIVVLAGGDGGIFRSDDLGAHWHTVYSTGGAAVTSLAWPTVRLPLIVAGINPGPHPLAVSLDGGATWHLHTHGLPAREGMMTVAVAPGAQVVYAGSAGRGIYVSTGPVDRWTGRNSGLPGLENGNADVSSFSFDPAHPAVLYAATIYGVYRSTDSGAHWAPFGQGLSGTAQFVTSLTLAPGPHPVLYATTAAGLYRIAL